MFQKLNYTQFAPDNPLMIWDGDCGFCKYWVLRWKKNTKEKITYKTYQEAAEDFKDIPVSAFREAARLIEPDGKIYDGPEAAYRSLTYAGKNWYYEAYSSSTFFQYFSDKMYQFIANNRSLAFRFTRIFWGKDPNKPKAYWSFYLVVFVIAILSMILL